MILRRLFTLSVSELCCKHIIIAFLTAFSVLCGLVQWMLLYQVYLRSELDFSVFVWMKAFFRTFFRDFPESELFLVSCFSSGCRFDFARWLHPVGKLWEASAAALFLGLPVWAASALCAPFDLFSSFWAIISFLRLVLSAFGFGDAFAAAFARCLFLNSTVFTVTTAYSLKDRISAVCQCRFVCFWSPVCFAYRTFHKNQYSLLVKSNL